VNSAFDLARPAQQPLYASTPQVPDERRRSARVDVLSRVNGELVAFNLPVTLVNISLGGFLIHGPVLLPIGTTAQFRFTMTDGERLVVRARAVHVMTTTTGDHTTYMTGLAVLPEDCESGLDTIVGALEDRKSV